MSKKIFITASIVVLGFLSSLWLVTSPMWAFFHRSDDPFAKCRSTQIIGGAGSIGGPFTLVDGAGQTVTDADVITKPSLVYFGYTFCPDV
ncbi:MAG: SCO family protein, partial [Paracoccaceae bacterium]